MTRARLALALALAMPSAAHAGGPRVRLTHLDASSCASEGIIRVGASSIELEGALAPTEPSRYRLVLDGTLLAAPPRASATLDASALPLRLAIVAQGSAAIEHASSALNRAGEALLGGLPGRARVDVLTFAAELTPRAQAAPVGEALAAWAGFVPDDRATVRTLDAVGAALTGLAEPPGPRRRVLVLIGDGRDGDLERDKVRALAARARALGVSISPIAYSRTQALAPEDREPFLGLGELAKQTGGTLRWARTADALAARAQELADELRAEAMLEFEVPDRCEVAHRVQLDRGGARSNALEVPKAEGGVSAGLIAGGVGVLMLGVGAALVALRRRPRLTR
jgi:hypothetical protein